MVSVRPAPIAAASPMDASMKKKPALKRSNSTVRTRVVSLLTGQSKSQYSAEKLLLFDDYVRTTSHWRMAFVMLCTPLPSLLTLLLPTLLPLRDPAHGILQNQAFCVHFVVIMGSSVFGAVVQGRAVTQLPHSEYTTLEAIAVALLSSTHLLGITIVVALGWRFPVPFTWALDFVPWVICLTWAHVLVFRGRLFRGVLREPVIAFLPSFIVQISQILIYPAFSAAFSVVNATQQVVLTLCFPVIKYYVKRLLRIASRSLNEYNEEVAVSGVEICAAMYQSQIMQNTPTLVATAVIIGIDVLQGVASVKMFMDKKNAAVERKEIVSTAVALLRARSRSSSKEQLVVPHESRDTKAKSVPSTIQIQATKGTQHHHRSGANKWLPCSSSHRTAVAIATTSVAPVAPIAAGRPRTGATATENEEDDGCWTIADARVVTHALEILHTAESILLVEYFEVAIPVVNGIFLTVASQMDSAKYNPNLRPFHQDTSRLQSAMGSLALYALLQGISVVAMALVMWYRFQLSSVAHLSFVLERHQWSLQGKLFSWLAVFFNFTLLHYGTDFTFKFDFTMPEVGES